MDNPLLNVTAVGQRLRETLAKKITFDRHVGLKDTVFLSSMGRSGSTFISNIINHDNRYRIIFEPFRPGMTKGLQDITYPMYLDPERSDPKYHALFEKILKGRIHSDWVDIENRKIFPRARLIKAIRANLFLKWLHNHFPEVKYILLLRHPCAVVDSWLNAGFGDGTKAQQTLLANPILRARMDGNMITAYSRAESPFERLIFFWCIYNWIPLQQFKKNELHLVFYENFVTGPQDELRGLFSFLGVEYNEAAVLSSLSKPSLTTNKKAASFQQSNAISRLESWQKRLSAQQLARADEILALFGMNDLYTPNSAVPNREVAARLFASH